MVKIIKVVYRLRTKVDQHTKHSNLLDDMGGEVGVEFSHHTHRSWMRWLEKCPPSLGCNSLVEEVVRVMETLFFNKISVLADGVEPISGTLFNDLVTSKFGVGSSLIRPRLVGNFCLLPDIGGSTRAPRKIMKSNGTKVARLGCLDNMSSTYNAL